MAKGVQATDVLVDLESLALRDLGHQTERLRAALARAAPSRGDAVEHGELSRALAQHVGDALAGCAQALAGLRLALERDGEEQPEPEPGEREQ